MKLTLHKWLVFTALGLLLAHNFIPHHHHFPTSDAAPSHFHEDDGHHHHSALAFVHVDEVFLAKSHSLKQVVSPAAALPMPIPALEDLFEIKPSGFVSTPSGRPPLLPFLTAFSFRPPPIA